MRGGNIQHNMRRSLRRQQESIFSMKRCCSLFEQRNTYW